MRQTGRSRRRADSRICRRAPSDARAGPAGAHVVPTGEQPLLADQKSVGAATTKAGPTAGTTIRSASAARLAIRPPTFTAAISTSSCRCRMECNGPTRGTAGVVVGFSARRTSANSAVYSATAPSGLSRTPSIPRPGITCARGTTASPSIPARLIDWGCRPLPGKDRMSRRSTTRKRPSCEARPSPG